MYRIFLLRHRSYPASWLVLVRRAFRMRPMVDRHRDLGAAAHAHAPPRAMMVVVDGLPTPTHEFAAPSPYDDIL